MTRIDPSEGRQLFGYDPASYDLARPGHPERVYEILTTRCGLARDADVLEVGPGTGQATRRLLERGASLVVVEPNERLADYLVTTFDERVVVLRTSLEDARVPAGSFELAAAASSFHWVDEAMGLPAIHDALRPGGWIALWWTLFGEGSEPDEFIRATTPLLEGLASSPTKGLAGRPPHALDVEARTSALEAAGFVDIAHELIRWESTWDSSGIRALYGSFSPILRLEDDERMRLLDEIALIAERDFGGRVVRTLTTSLYTARKPSGTAVPTISS
jgi:SAM-dependent methyltransferase